MSAGSPGDSDSSERPARTFRMTAGRRIAEAVVGPMVRAGVVPRTYLLTTRGRKTGRLRRNPVTIIEWDGRQWLVAPYGPVSWVHNARAAGQVTLSRRGTSVDYTLREVGPDEAGPVLKRYVNLSRPTRPYFAAAADAPVAEFSAEADRHPVFELTRVT